MGNESSKVAEEKRNRELFVQSHFLSIDGEEDLHLDDVDFDLAEQDHETKKINPKKYDFCFENLVFEGGGMKGASYVGATMYLEELKLDKQIKRYGGTSAGAMMAAYLAMGYKTEDIKEFISPDYISSILIHNPMGILNLIPNMLRHYGWKPTTRLFEAMGEHFEAKTGDPDITFKQLYKKTGKELCICVTNVNHMEVTYCHVKTTPSLPIRQAVCMSMSIPGYFQAVKITHMGETDVYVDGGILCNYPIHCFDGWFLSMAPEDNFFDKFQPLSKISHLYDKSVRFGTKNEKTLGFLLYSEKEQETMKGKLDNRPGAIYPERPSKDTKLYKRHVAKLLKKKKAEKIHVDVVNSVDAFLRAIKKYNIGHRQNVDLGELKLIFEDNEIFTERDRLVLFGKKMTAEEAFEVLDTDHDGEIEFDELVDFIQRTGICLQNVFKGYTRREIDGLDSYFRLLKGSLELSVKRLHMSYADIERTVGINTGHVETTDFTMMEDADVEFLEKRGYNSMKAFLQHYVNVNNLEKKKKDRKSRPRTRPSKT